jgi:hypothetical protein
MKHSPFLSSIFFVKPITWLTIVFASAFLFNSCQKEDSRTTTEVSFNADSVKEWYYGAFKKSAEWQTSPMKGKKLPDWKHPVIGKIGNNDAIEFPLVKETTSFSIPAIEGNTALTTAERTRVAEASLSKIVFIKNSDGNMLVREIDYVPSWQYLRENKFDVSHASLMKSDNNFSGLVVVKQWDGTIISKSMFSGGKFTMKGKGSNTKNNQGAKSNLMEETACYDVEYCVWQQDCTIEIIADQITEICGEWYNTGNCWTEQYCPQVVGTPCQLYGIGCDDSVGDPPSSQCNMSREDADNALAAITSVTEYEATSGSGSETPPDANGIIRKPLNIHRHSQRYNWGLGYSSKYTLFFNAVLYKTVSNSTWKFETFAFDQITKADGAAPPCYTVVVTASVSGVIINNQASASFTSTITCSVSIACLGGLEMGTKTDNINGQYEANDPTL